MEYEYSPYTRDPGQGTRIVVIGGGTGLSVLLRGLKKNSGLHISAIVTVADDGGGSGMLRKDLGMLPPGDVRNCILALADEEDIMEQLLQYRFGSGRLKGQNMGNLFIAALTDIYGDFELAVEKLHDILRIQGKVIPVTSEDVTLCARLKNGKVIRGESRIPKAVSKMKSPIEEVFLDPSGVRPLDSAVEAILKADMIVLGPGSLYSSIIPNLLVSGISDAIRTAGGMKVLVCNVMTQAGETDNYTVVDYVDAVERYLGSNVAEYILINDYICQPEELSAYTSAGTCQMCAAPGEREILGTARADGDREQSHRYLRRNRASRCRPDRKYFADDDTRSLARCAEHTKTGEPLRARLFSGKCDLLSLFEGRTFCFRAACAVGENAVLTGNFDGVRCAVVVRKVDAFRYLAFYCSVFTHLNHLSSGSFLMKK